MHMHSGTFQTREGISNTSTETERTHTSNLKPGREVGGGATWGFRPGTVPPGCGKSHIYFFMWVDATDGFRTANLKCQ